MKFVLFVEGHTEKKAAPAFLKRWLDVRLGQKVAIKVVRFDGWAEMVKDLPIKVPMHLHGLGSEDTLAAIGLLDLYGPTFYPPELRDAEARRAWATRYLQDKVGKPRFHMYFAVHEVEAWLLSDLGLFPANIGGVLPGAARKPEMVNFAEPPKDQCYL